MFKHTGSEGSAFAESVGEILTSVWFNVCNV